MSDSINGDDEKLYDLILKNLQSTGILHNYKIQLTDEILKILNNETTEEPQPQYEKIKLSLNSDENILCLHLIKDTLDYLGLHYTSLMLEKEIGGLSNLYNNISKNDIEKQIDKLKFLISKNNLTNSHNYQHHHHNNNNSLSNSENNQNNDTVDNHNHNYSNSIAAATSSPSSSSQPSYSSKFSTQNDNHNDSSLININKPILLKILDNIIKNELSSSSSTTTNRDNSSPHAQNTISNETFTKSPSD